MTSTEDGSESGSASESSSSGDSMPCPVGELGCACTEGGGCDPGLTCNDALLCESAPDSSEATSLIDTTDTSSGGETSTGDSSSSGGETTVSPAECTKVDGKVNQDCLALDPQRPFCGDDGVCAGCVDDMQCADGTDDLSPICLDSGACGECDVADTLNNGQCSAKQPHCDLDKFECEGCLEHSECPGTACDVAARTCFTGDRILYVRRGPTMNFPCTYDVPTGGSQDMPYCDMQPAIDHAQYNGTTSGWIFIMMASDSEEEHNEFVIPGGDTPFSYAIKHEPGTVLDRHTRFLDYGPVITVSDKVTLYLIDMGVDHRMDSFADSHRGIDCLSGGSIWLDDSRILRSVGPGIKAENCEIHMRRSSIAFGRTEGIDMTGGSLHMVNSFIDENGSKDGYGGGAIKMGPGSVADIVYSTIVNNANEKLTGRGDTVDCTGAVTLKIRNSVFARRPGTANPSIVCEGSEVTITNSVVDGEVEVDQGNNKLAAEDILDALLPDTLTGAYRIPDLDAAMNFVQAVRQAGDPHDDYEYQIREALMNDMDYAGADYYQP